MMANAIASATANSGCRRLKCNPLAVLIARHLAPGDFFGGITWNFSFGFLRLIGSIQQKPVALSHRWLLSRQAADFESRGSSAGRAFILIVSQAVVSSRRRAPR